MVRLDKSLLESHVGVEAVDSVLHVNVDQPALASLQKVQVDGGGKADAEIRGQETRIPVRQVGGKEEGL